MLREWVANCGSEHQKCRQHPTETSKCENERRTNIPTRLIDVGSIKDCPPRSRLVNTNGIPKRYVALSHRWAQTRTLETTADNIASLRIELPEKNISPTFRDAIEVTRQLGFRYLWLDSLCIIQGDAEDWKRESHIMGSIFAGASVTIAAVDSVDEDGIDRGMLLRRLDPLEVTISLPFDREPLAALSKKVFGVVDKVYIWKCKWLATKESTPDSIYEQNTITLRPRITSLGWNMKRSRWYNRGWVLQERLLARRIIYFNKKKIYWSCFTTTHDEEGGDPEYAIRSSIYSTPRVTSSQRWQDIVDEYVRCHLTFNTDRLVAIEEISQIMKTYSSLQVYAGIPDDKTATPLLWYTKLKPLQKFNDFHAPSWTWASLNGIISFYLPSPPDATSKPLVEDLSFGVKATSDVNICTDKCKDACVSCQVSLTCPVGNVQRSIRLKDAGLESAPADIIDDDDVLRLLLGSAVVYSGYPMPRFDVSGNLVSKTRPLFVPDHTELLVDNSGAFIGFFIPDMEKEDDDQIKIVCASIEVWRVPGTIRRENDTIEVVGIQSMDQSNEVFRRVGRGRIMCNAWLPRCEMRQIVIV
jgi:hypothetical protein